jgi:hypothetical protein
MLDAARLAQVQFGLALLVLIVVLAALAWRNLSPLAPDLVLPRWWPRAGLSALGRRRARWAVDGVLALVALSLALLSITAARPSGAGLDRGRVLHEAVQAKYHAELGWDGLYPCAWAADRAGARAISGVEVLRMLEPGPPPVLEPTLAPERNAQGIRPRRSPPPAPTEVGGKLLPVRTTPELIDCRARFDEPRWTELGADLAALANLDPHESVAAEFRGFGPTATPARLARQRLVFALLPISGGVLFGLALLGGLLVLAALVLVGRTYGLRVAALLGVVAFVELGASPIAGGATTTGALVLAATLAGFALVEHKRWGLAGALLAFVAVELVWPSALVLALLAKLGADLGRLRDQRRREFGRFAIGVGATAAALLLLSATLPGGLGNWSSWADQLALHRYADGSREVGLRWLFVPDGNLLTEPGRVPYPDKAQLLVDRRGWILTCALLLLTPALLAVRRLPPVGFATIAGVAAVFGFGSTDASAWGLALPLLVLGAGAVAKHHPGSTLLIGRPTTVLVAGCLALCVGMHGLVRVHVYAPFVFNVVYSHLLATLLLGLGVALVLLPDLREPGDPPDAPASVPTLEPATAAAAPRFKLRRRRSSS